MDDKSSSPIHSCKTDRNKLVLIDQLINQSIGNSFVYLIGFSTFATLSAQVHRCEGQGRKWATGTVRVGGGGIKTRARAGAESASKQRGQWGGRATAATSPSRGFNWNSGSEKGGECGWERAERTMVSTREGEGGQHVQERGGKRKERPIGICYARDS